MRYFILTVLFALVIACNDDAPVGSGNADTSKVRGRDSAGNNQNLPNVTGCYLRAFKQDTLVAHLQQQGNRIFGKLTFDNYQKDGSTGKVEGFLEDNIIKLQYAFHSEGMYSVMDVYFKISGDSLIRGIGTMQTRGDTAYFTDPSKIEFAGSVLKKLPCGMLQAKYRE